MILYIVIIAFLALLFVNVTYEIKRAKRIRKESTKLDSEVYRRKDGNR